MVPTCGSTTERQLVTLSPFISGVKMDTRPFPQNLRVWVKNTNVPEPNSDDHFSGTCSLQYDGELYDFPPGKGVLVSPEHAYWQWLWDTRSDVNERGQMSPPRNYR